MFKVNWIKQKIESSSYYYSGHGDKERKNDNLTLMEIEQALLDCKIIEQYPDISRGESCLAVGFTKAGKPIHIVCGEKNEQLAIITVYIPTPPKFINPYQRGK